MQTRLAAYTRQVVVVVAAPSGPSEYHVHACLLIFFDTGHGPDASRVQMALRRKPQLPPFSVLPRCWQVARDAGTSVAVTGFPRLTLHDRDLPFGASLLFGFPMSSRCFRAASLTSYRRSRACSRTGPGADASLTRELSPGVFARAGLPRFPVERVGQLLEASGHPCQATRVSACAWPSRASCPTLGR